MKLNPILQTDSYKASHYLQYPPNMTGYFGYIEARKPANPTDQFNETVFFGLQIFLKEYMTRPITLDDIDEAEKFFKAHGEPFNRSGWEYILNRYDGYMPVTIKAVPEGSVVPEGNVLVTVMCTDPVCSWVGSYLETVLLRACWYGSTVATISRECKKVLLDYLVQSSDNPRKEIMFKLHDFGMRGCSSSESAGIGGAAHLINFMGSDTLDGIICAQRYYDNDMPGYSIPASEHSTITAWGQDHEIDAYRNMLNTFGKPTAVFACVSDSYDVFNACEKLWGNELRDEVIKSGATVVIRLDSGDPAQTVLKCLRILDKQFGNTLNKKRYKVLNHVKVIQGDGINLNSLKDICETVVSAGYSLDNVNFGMGGALLQHLNRDTLRFAMKCSAIRINGTWVNVSKKPITDPSKNSKEGLLMLYQKERPHGRPVWFTADSNAFQWPPEKEHAYVSEMLHGVYVNGKLYNQTTFEDVRKRAAL